MKTVISENCRGLKFNNGKFIEMLGPGKYITFGNTKIETLGLDEEIIAEFCTLNVLLENRQFADAVETVEVGDEQLALHYADGRFCDILCAGKHAFWKASAKHEFVIADLSAPEVDESIPDYIFSKISTFFYTKVEVAEYQKARLYYNKKFVRLLDAGTYYFWNSVIKVSYELVDTRLLQLHIAGQEMLTQDKVTLRLNFVCGYKITDFVRIATEIDSFEEQLHTAAQLALRDYVGRYKLDEILENKQAVSEAVFEKLRSKQKELFVQIYSADVKDIILPGEVRDIMNTVLIAEKRAQANVITRREEVASTRSLLNTAKLMEENPTLYRLKELEYVERICENVGNINVNGSGDLLAQLGSILHGGSVR